MKIIDISKSIGPQMVLWPDDPKITVTKVSDITTDKCNVSAVNMGLHAGTHVDAPWHYIAQGKKVDELDLSFFCGPCKIFEIKKEAHLSYEELKDCNIDKGDIVLFKTRNSYEEKDFFNKEYCALTYSAAQHLVEKKVKTVGIDYLSIEAYEGTGDVHKLLLSNEIAVLEGLDLSLVNPGEYLLSALPLKLSGAEGSPVRAVLIEL